VVDEDGDVIDILVQAKRDRHAAARFFRKLLKGQGAVPRRLITDKLRSYAAAHRVVMPSAGPRHRPVREQSSRSLSSTDAPARTADGALQVGRPSATLRVGARRRAESLSSGPSSAAVGSPPTAAKAGEFIRYELAKGARDLVLDFSGYPYRQ
jgi:putative transposase